MTLQLVSFHLARCNMPVNLPKKLNEHLPQTQGDTRVPRVIRPRPTVAQVKPLNERLLLTTIDIAETRMAICKQCDSFEDWSCKVANSFMPVATRKKGTSCPRGFWSSDWGSGV